MLRWLHIHWVLLVICHLYCVELQPKILIIPDKYQHEQIDLFANLFRRVYRFGNICSWKKSLESPKNISFSEVDLLHCRKKINQFFDPIQRSYLGLRSSGIVLQIASIGVVFNPGDLVLTNSADGILHRLVHNRVHRWDKEVQGCQQLFSILCQVPLSICNSTFCLTSWRTEC